MEKTHDMYSTTCENVITSANSSRRHFRHFVIMLTIGLLAPTVRSFTQTSAKSLLWEITGKGLSRPSYLFGTYHLLNDSYLSKEQPLALEKFQQADGVVVEIIPDTPAMMQAQIKMFMEDDHLSKLLDSVEYQVVGSEIKQQTGVELAQFEQFKPMALCIMLTLAYSQTTIPTLNNYQGVPLDLYFAQTGQKKGKTVTALETIAEQFDLLFSKFTLEEQTGQLVEMIEKKDLTINTLKGIAETYMQADLEGMHAVSERMQKEMPHYGSMEFITTDRNKRWMKRLPALLQKGSQFIAVGALHLPGKDGLIDLLQKDGYTVKPVLAPASK